MSKFPVAPSQRLFVQKSAIELQFMALKASIKDGLTLNWTDDKNFASHYPSKYAAKKHLKILQQNFELPETIQIVE